mgnify:FL=1
MKVRDYIIAFIGCLLFWYVGNKLHQDDNKLTIELQPIIVNSRLLGE